ncbi:hypothetical protein ILUMI_03059 [Ignelater luminosus]|uniref:Uncharacterized protein n=1 Tax=Ignelater luminosus TaxID=2038154 RepID=A0A8K0DFC7_IGNLU|nr:hypothetical protein ILUMI_03059 [Ignelater luminosus]
MNTLKDYQKEDGQMTGNCHINGRGEDQNHMARRAKRISVARARITPPPPRVLLTVVNFISWGKCSIRQRKQLRVMDRIAQPELITQVKYISNAELELELLHGLLEDCSNSESYVSDEDLSPACDSGTDFIPRSSISSDSDENLNVIFGAGVVILFRTLPRFLRRNALNLKAQTLRAEVCVTTFHEKNGARPSFEVGSRHVGKNKSTIRTVTAYNTSAHSRFFAQNVLKEAASPTVLWAQ